MMGSTTALNFLAAQALGLPEWIVRLLGPELI